MNDVNKYSKLKTTKNSNNRIYYILLNLLFGFSMFLITKSFFLLVTITFLATITFIIAPKEKNAMKWINISLFLFIIIMLLTYYGWLVAEGAPYISGGSDDLTYEKLGRLYQENSWYNFTHNHGYSTNTRLYVSFIAVLNYLGNLFDGYNTFIPRVFNGYFEVWIIIMLYFLLKDRYSFDNRIINLSLAAISLNPYYKYINSHVFRDTMSLLFFFIVILLFNSYQTKEKNIFKLIMIALMLFLSFYLRSQLLLVEIAGIIIMSIFKGRRSKVKIILLVLVILFSLIFDYSTNVFGFFESSARYIEYQGMDGGFSSRIMSIKLFPFGAILRYLYAIVVPWPNIFGLFQNFNYVLLDIIYLASYLYVFWQVSNILTITRGALVNYEFGVLFLLTLSLYTLVSFTFRHTIFFYPFLSVAYGLGYNNSTKFNNKDHKIKKILILSAFTTVILLYAIIKY